MVLLPNNNKNRVRRHNNKYIAGFGDGDTKPPIVTKIVGYAAHHQRMMPRFVHNYYSKNQDETTNYDKNDSTGEKDEKDETNPSRRRSYLRRARSQATKKDQQNPEVNNSITTNGNDLPNHTREYPGDSNEKIWNRINFPDQRQRKPEHSTDFLNNNNNNHQQSVGGTGGIKDLLQNQPGPFNHPNTVNNYYSSNVLQQSTEECHFPLCIVFIATVILIIRMFVNVRSDQRASSSSSTTGMNNSSSEMKKTTPGHDNSSSITNPTTKFNNNSGIISNKNNLTIRQASRKPKTDEWNEDYEGDPTTGSNYYYYDLESRIFVGSNSTNTDYHHHVAIHNDPINTMNVSCNYQPLIGSPGHPNQQYRQRKATSGSGIIGSTSLPSTTVVNSSALRLKEPIHYIQPSIEINVPNQYRPFASSSSSKVQHNLQPTSIHSHSSHELYTASYGPLGAQQSPSHDTAPSYTNPPSYTNHHQYRTHYAQPSSTTDLSFKSLKQYPELVNPLSPSDSSGSYTDSEMVSSFENVHKGPSNNAGDNDEFDNSIPIGYVEEPSHTKYNDVGTPYRQRDELTMLTYKMGATSFDRYIPPVCDDTQCLDQYDEIDTNQNTSNLDDRTEPQRFLTTRTKISDLLLDETPCVTNGRRTSPNENVKLNTSTGHNPSLPNSKHVKFPDGNPSLPFVQQQQQPFPEAKSGISILAPPRNNDDSNSTSFSDLRNDFSDTDGGMKFASPSKYPKKLIDHRDWNNDDDENDVLESKRQSIPPNLCAIPSMFPRPPKSINMDSLRVSLRVSQSHHPRETGNVSHWQARVAEESQILYDHHKFNDDAEGFDSYPSNYIESDDVILSKYLHENNGNENIRDQVMAAATDVMSTDTIPSDYPGKSIARVRGDLTDDTDAASSLQGTINFSELQLIEVIGGGGFGQVWRAVWRCTPVAVKVLTGSAQSKSVPKIVLQEFAAEINMLKGMRHPNICLYMGACLTAPNRAIITELAANGSLWDALRLPLVPPYIPCDGLTRVGWPLSMYQPDARYDTIPIISSPQRSTSTPSSKIPVPPKGTWHWVLVKHVAIGAARCMAYLHSGKPPILHRDLKSANILLDDSYTAKVCDFGLSRLKAHEATGSMTGNVGTAQWMAPELLSNERYNEKADVYSYGIICWELLTAKCPYGGMTPTECALAVYTRDERPTIPDWCPPSFQTLIRSCWKRDPALRPTFEQIIAVLDSMT